jgi:hypothetical protein
MRKHLCFIALSLLAAAFAGWSSTEKDPTVSVERHDLTNALAKHNGARVTPANIHSPTALLV